MFNLTGALGYFLGVPHRTLLLNGAVLFTGGSGDLGNLNWASPGEMCRKDREKPAPGRKLEYLGRMGADCRNVYGVAEPVHRPI